MLTADAINFSHSDSQWHIVNNTVSNLKILQFQKGELDTPPEVSSEWNDEIYYEDCMSSEADSEAADDKFSSSDTDTTCAEDDDTESFASQKSLNDSDLYTDVDDENPAIGDDKIDSIEAKPSIQE